MLKKDKTRRRTGPSTPTGMDVTSERELLLMGENYRLKDKIDRVIEHAEETISELQVEINSTKQYYIEREEKLQAITDGVQAELREQQNVTEKLTLELDQERLKLSKAAHFIELQQKAGLLKSTEGLGTSEAQSSHYKDVVLSELMGDAEGLDPQDHEHHHGPSPMSSPLKVTATSPLRIDIAELRSTTDSRLERSPFRLSSEGGNSANSSRSGVSQAYYQSEISKLEADLEKAKKEAVSAYGLIEQLANSDEILAKYEASRSRERQLLKHIKASTPMKKSQLFKKNSRGRAGESTSPDGAPSLHAVHHAGKVKFGKSRGLKLLPRDLGSRVATKSQREERKRRTGNHWGKTDVSYTAPESDDGRVSEAHGGTSPGSDGSDEGAASTLISDDDMITTREAISRCIRDELHEAWVGDSGGGKEKRPHLGVVLEALHKKLHVAMMAMREREEEAEVSKREITGTIEEKTSELKVQIQKLEEDFTEVDAARKQANREVGNLTKQLDEAKRDLVQGKRGLEREVEELTRRLQNAHKHEETQSGEIAAAKQRCHDAETKAKGTIDDLTRQLKLAGEELETSMNKSKRVQQSTEAAISARVAKMELEFAQRAHELKAEQKEEKRRLEKRVSEVVADCQALDGRLAAAEEAHSKALKRMVPVEEVDRMEQEATDALKEADLNLDRAESKSKTLEVELRSVKAREREVHRALEELERKLIDTRPLQERSMELGREVKELTDSLDDAEACIAELEQEAVKREEAHAKAKHERDEAREEVEAVSKKAGDAQDKVDVLERDLQELGAAKDGLENDLHDALAETKASSETILLLEQQLLGREEELGNLQSELEEHRIEQGNLRQSLQGANDDKKQFVKQQEQLFAKNQAVEGELRETSSQMEDCLTELSTLRTAHEAVASELDRHKSSSESDFLHLRELNRGLEKEIEASYASVAAARKDLANARKALVDNRKEDSLKHDALAAALDEAKAQLSSATLRAEALDSEKMRLTEAKATAEGHHKRSLEACSALEAEIRKLKDQLQDSKAVNMSIEASNMAITNQLHQADLASQVSEGRIADLEEGERALKTSFNELNDDFESVKDQLREQLSLNEDKKTALEEHLSEIKELRAARSDLARKVEESTRQYKTAINRISDLSSENEHLEQALEKADEERQTLNTRYEENRKKVIARAAEERALLIEQHEQDKEEMASVAKDASKQAQTAHSKELALMRKVAEERQAEVERLRAEVAEHIEDSEALTRDLRNHHESTVSRQKQSLMTSHASVLAEIKAAADEREHYLTDQCDTLEKNKAALQEAMQKLKANHHVSITKLQKHVTELEEQLKTTQEALQSRTEAIQHNSKTHEEHVQQTSTRLAHAQAEVTRLQEGSMSSREEVNRLTNEVRVAMTERDALMDEKSRYSEKLEEATRQLRAAQATIKEREIDLEKVKREISQHEEEKLILHDKYEHVRLEKEKADDELRASKLETGSLRTQVQQLGEDHRKALADCESQERELQTSLSSLSKKYGMLQSQREKDKTAHQAEIDLLTRHQSDILQSHEENTAMLEEQYRQSSARDKVIAEKALTQQREAAEKKLKSLQEALEASERSFAESMGQLEALRAQEKDRFEELMRGAKEKYEERLRERTTVVDFEEEELRVAQAECEDLRQLLATAKQANADAAADSRREVDAANKKVQQRIDMYNKSQREVESLTEQLQQAKEAIEAQTTAHLLELKKEQTAVEHLEEANSTLREEAAEAFAALAAQAVTMNAATVTSAPNPPPAGSTEGGVEGQGQRPAPDATAANPVLVEELKKKLDSSKMLITNSMKRLKEANNETKRMEEHKVRAEVLQQQLDSKEDMLRELIAEGKRTALRAEKKDEEAVLMHKQLHEAEAREQATSSRVAEMEKSIAAASAEQKKAEQALITVREEAESSSAIQASIMAEKEKEFDVLSRLLQAEREERSEEVRGLQDEISSMQAGVTRQEEDHHQAAAALHAQIVTLEDSHTTKLNALSEAEQMIKDKDRHVSVASSEVKGLRKALEIKVQELEKQIKKTNELRKKDAQESEESLNSQILTLKAAVDSATDEKKALLGRAVEASREIETLQASLLAREEELKALQIDNASTREELASLKAQHESTATARDGLADHVRRLLHALGDLNSSPWAISEEGNSDVTHPEGATRAALSADELGSESGTQTAIRHELDFVRDRLASKELELQSARRQLSSTARTLRLLQEDILLCSYEDVITKVRAERGVDLRRLIRKRRRTIPSHEIGGAEDGDEHYLDTADSSDGGFSDTSSAVRRMRLPGEMEDLSSDTPSGAIAGTDGEAEILPASRIESNIGTSSSFSPSATEDLLMAPPTVSVSRYGGKEGSRASKGEESSPSAVQVVGTSSVSGSGNHTPEESLAETSPLADSNAVTAVKSAKEARRPPFSAKKAETVGRQLFATDTHDEVESDVTFAGSDQDGVDSESVDFEDTSGGETGEDTAAKHHRRRLRARRGKARGGANGSIASSITGMGEVDSSSGDDTDVEHHASAMPRALLEEIYLLTRRLDASHASRSLLVRQQHKALAIVQREIERRREESNRLHDDLVVERKRVAFLTESRAKAYTLLVSSASGDHTKITMEDVNESRDEYSPHSPSNHPGKAIHPSPTIIKTKNATEEDAEASMVSFVSDVGSSVDDDFRLIDLPKEQLVDMLLTSQRSSRESQAASMNVVRAAKDAARSMEAEITSLEERLHGVNNAYASLQRSCLEHEYEYNEGTKALVHTMETNRLESHGKINALSSKLRSLHLERQGQS